MKQTNNNRESLIDRRRHAVGHGLPNGKKMQFSFIQHNVQPPLQHIQRTYRNVRSVRKINLGMGMRLLKHKKGIRFSMFYFFQNYFTLSLLQVSTNLHTKYAEVNNINISFLKMLKWHNKDGFMD